MKRIFAVFGILLFIYEITSMLYKHREYNDDIE